MKLFENLVYFVTNFGRLFQFFCEAKNKMNIQTVWGTQKY